MNHWIPKVAGSLGMSLLVLLAAGEPEGWIDLDGEVAQGVFLGNYIRS